MNKIVKYDILLQVKVRKYDVDVEKLKATLISHKREYKLTNKYISEVLGRPQTLVEHWFRSDNCFSIPEGDIWHSLKALLKITTDEFDESVTEFEYRDGVYDKANRLYDSCGIAPTLTTVSSGNELILVEEDVMNLIQIGSLGSKHEQSGRVYDADGICPTIMAGSRKTCTGGYVAPKILVNSFIEKPNKNKLFKGEYDMEKLRVFEAFAGYGSQSVALDNIGVPHEVVAISEIDADVTISYGAIRGDITKPVKLSDEEIKEWLMSRNVGWDFQKQKSSIPRMKKDKLHKLYNACLLSNNLGDVSKINPTDIPDHDLFTYSFPCTDISVAGQMKGLEKGSGTRSGLLWECEKIIAAKKPKYLLMENVKNLVGKKFKAEFDTWCDWLEVQGYKNFYKILNSKDYGVPQNRERVFMISILDENATYEFPEKFPLELRLKDILEDVVDEKYYIDNEASNRLLDTLKNKVEEEIKLQSIGNVNPSGNGMNGNVVNSDGLAATVTTNKGEGQKIVCEQRCDEGLRFFKGDVCGTIRTIEAGGDKRVIECGAIRGRYEDDGSIVQKLELNGEDNTNTITTVQKDNMLLEKTDELKLYDNLSGGKWDKIHESARRVYDESGLSPTIPTCQGGNIEPKAYSNYRIRKLTPKECWRLMGMKDEHFEKCVNIGVSNSQLYKQAGNSIVVDVLEYIFKELFKEYIVSEGSKENF